MQILTMAHAALTQLWDFQIRAGPHSHSLGKASLGSILTDVCVSAVDKESVLDCLSLLAHREN